ncbi:3-isopropylmalate dehydrogenase [Symbiobacterium terraclitae]|uniref:3-isopropylmalate dehydrogenase n=1 Tax=Symbiobacterium terraclitae TaxID=557451 RepID=A0ABS4JN59_9FIRM|nr:3-isopropylmalate dehydrogenase [Symbiobacterium terraclitae]MBP2016959.1 3-isopropylmalate dehydrogenase [Symbiobacterium terraclitae]
MARPTYRIACLPGDGIGPEVTRGAVTVLEAAAAAYGFALEFSAHPVGGAAYDAAGTPFPDETREACDAADAILFGAVGGPQYDGLPWEHRPEAALLAIRKRYDLYANLRPILLYPPLRDASPLKNEIIGGGVDFIIVRELVGGIYFGEPRGITTLEDGTRRGVNTEVYTDAEIARIARMGFTIARGRRRKVTSVDKANVMEAGRLWRTVVDEVAREFPDVEVEHLLADNAAMQILRRPGDFDVMLASNLFGDFLSDEAAMLTGSIGLLPSASLGAAQNRLGLPKGFYEPIHGSAPDIAGRDLANPLAAILCGAMLLRHSLGQEEAALAVERAVVRVLEEGFRTGDIKVPGTAVLGTAAMAAEVARRIG